MAVDMTQVWQAASDLVDGHAAPSIRLALWAAALSPQNALDNNGRQVERLRPYANGGLPHEAARVRAVVGGQMLSAVKIEALIRIDKGVEDGSLAWVGIMPTTPRAWLSWRSQVAALYGMSWKTASFTALLLWPFDAPFVPVDTHVMRRFGLHDMADKVSSKGKPGYHRYRSVERRVFNEWRDAGKPAPIALWHWFKWDQQRGSAAVESHTLLSPYVY